MIRKEAANLPFLRPRGALFSESWRISGERRLFGEAVIREASVPEYRDESVLVATGVGSGWRGREERGCKVVICD
jgi:hypothetical protein